MKLRVLAGSQDYIMEPDFDPRATSSFAWDFGFQGESNRGVGGEIDGVSVETKPDGQSRKVVRLSQFLDDETGYVNYGFRHYLPYIGRWVNRDPIEEKGGDNLYMMVENDGVNGVDLLGLAIPTNPFDPKFLPPSLKPPVDPKQTAWEQMELAKAFSNFLDDTLKCYEICDEEERNKCLKDAADQFERRRNEIFGGNPKPKKPKTPPIKPSPEMPKGPPLEPIAPVTPSDDPLPPFNPIIK